MVQMDQASPQWLCFLRIRINSSIQIFSLISLLCWNVHCLSMSICNSRIQLKDHFSCIMLFKRCSSPRLSRYLPAFSPLSFSFLFFSYCVRSSIINLFCFLSLHSSFLYFPLGNPLKISTFYIAHQQFSHGQLAPPILNLSIKISGRLQWTKFTHGNRCENCLYISMCYSKIKYYNLSKRCSKVYLQFFT